MADNSTSTAPSRQDSSVPASSDNAKDPRGDRNRGGRGRGRQQRGRGKGFSSKDSGERHRKRDMGRGEYNRNNVDRRAQNNEEQAAKRRKTEDGGKTTTFSTPFTKEEIEAETRRPKRKVAVMIGYAGSGYKGMQINAQEKTIEGDLFKAFVAAGAISKNNSDDPKKTSLVRCARTDKGVHAAGNVISLKLIVEEPNIVETINENLPPQIRVWELSGQMALSVATRLVIQDESAEEEGVFETYQSLQEDASSFWKDAESTYVESILSKLDPPMREAVMETIYSTEEENEEPTRLTKKQRREDSKRDVDGTDQAKFEVGEEHAPAHVKKEKPASMEEDATVSALKSEDTNLVKEEPALLEDEQSAVETVSVLTPLEIAVKEVKAAYITAKKAYRISAVRRQRVQETLDCYIGTRNFHNYTIQKSFSDPSAKRVIRSFKVGAEPIIINDTEWLSLKVHGQSFMMHQIRKMVAMAALVVRCGTPREVIAQSYGPANISIPKAPGLGLLLERPVFDSYNERAVREFNRQKLDFDKYQKEMEEFKQREIYDRIFREEEKDHQFHAFFHHIDHYRTDYFLWVTAKGISAATQSKALARTDDASDEEADANGEEG